MNNKKLGSAFEREVCDILAASGWWVHFIAPDARGAQPFDIIAVKDGRAVAIDCKTCVSNRIALTRLEDNQILAFERWIACGNEMPVILVKHNGAIYRIPYNRIKAEKSVRLGKELLWFSKEY